MPPVLDPFRFVLIAIAGWMNQRQLQVIDYLREENRVLREQVGERRLRLSDDQRRRLAAKAKGSRYLPPRGPHPRLPANVRRDQNQRSRSPDKGAGPTPLGAKFCVCRENDRRSRLMRQADRLWPASA